MTQTERVFPFNKSIMLNVIYDTLDRLGAAVESCNSERGALDFALADRRCG